MRAEGEMKLVMCGGGDDTFQLHVSIQVDKPFAASFGTHALCYCDTASQARELLSLLRSHGVEVELTQVVKKTLEVEK